MKKIIICVLLLSLVFSLISCDTTTQKQDEESQTNQEEWTTTGEVESSIDLVANGKAARIVYSLSADGTIITLANTLAESIENLTGIRPKTGDDWVKEGNQRDTGTVEILIGKTEYQESIQAYNSIHYGVGTVEIIGNKVVVAGYNSEACQSAVTKLIIALGSAKKDNEIHLSREYKVSVSNNGVVAEIPVFEKRDPQFIDCGDSCWELLFTGETQTAYQGYLNTLVNDGFQLYTQSESTNNLFSTYTNDEVVVTTIFHKGAGGYMRLLVEPRSKTALPELTNEYKMTNKAETTITQLGLYYGDTPVNGYAQNYYNGMAYVMRLDDGSFIIVDGGHNTQGHADRLYALLQSQAPDPNHIVIAAWLFSHAHYDHVGVFSYFTNSYGKNVTVEKFIYNFPAAGRGTKEGGGSDYISNVDLAIRSSCYANSQKIKAHPGQTFYIRNAKIQILLTLEMAEPFTLDYYNDSSTIFTVEAENVKMIFLGDCGTKENEVLRKYYVASELKCDIVQVSHHAINGCGTELYSLIQPSYAFVPIGSTKINLNGTNYTNIMSFKVNNYFKSTNNFDTSHVLVAGAKISTLKLKNGNITIAS